MSWVQSYSSVELVLFILFFTGTVSIGVYTGSLLHELAHYFAAAWNNLSARTGLPLNLWRNSRPICQTSGEVSIRGYIAIIGTPSCLLILITFPVIVFTSFWNRPTLIEGFLWGLAFSSFSSIPDLVMIYRILRDPSQLDYYAPSKETFETEPAPVSGIWLMIDPLTLMNEKRISFVKP